MEYEVVKSNRKTLAIEITKEARVIVRAPLGVSMWKIRRFLKEKESVLPDYKVRKKWLKDQGRLF